MSSNQSIKKICQHCNEVFIAQKATTKFCSLKCAQRNYKLRQKNARIKKSNDANVQILQSKQPAKQEKGSSSSVTSELIDIKALSALTSLSERTLFRLIKDDNFPKLRIGRNLLFHQQTVINYLMNKYGNL